VVDVALATVMLLGKTFKAKIVAKRAGVGVLPPWLVTTIQTRLPLIRAGIGAQIAR
jgi:hypothetical protein